VKRFLRELIIYQLVAVALALINEPYSHFLRKLPSYLIVTNCIAWSIRSLFALVSVRVHFLRWRRRWQLVFGLPVVAAGCFIGILVASVIVHFGFNEDIGRSLLITAFKTTLPAALVVTIVILGYFSFRDRLETQAVERERLKGLKAKAELAALQSKLDPHFLFNTLNTMVNLVHKEPDRVEEMIMRLSDIYRRVLNLPSTERISLSEEFDLAGHYLAIEQIRLGERLRYEIRLPDNLREVQVPPLMVQPLVENAVIHGIMPAPAGGNLQLSVVDRGDRIQILVEDDGVGFNAEGNGVDGDDGRDPAKRGPGYGIHGTRERARLAYGGRAEMRIISQPDHGTRITLELPVEH
jgi:two-component system LytT family sensor kinase